MDYHICIAFRLINKKVGLHCNKLFYIERYFRNSFKNPPKLLHWNYPPIHTYLKAWHNATNVTEFSGRNTSIILEWHSGNAVLWTCVLSWSWTALIVHSSITIESIRDAQETQVQSRKLVQVLSPLFCEFWTPSSAQCNISESKTKVQNTAFPECLLEYHHEQELNQILYHCSTSYQTKKRKLHLSFLYIPFVS